MKGKPKAVPVKKPAPAPVAGGTRVAGGRSGASKYSYHDLTEDARMVYDSIKTITQDQGGTYSLENFIDENLKNGMENELFIKRK